MLTTLKVGEKNLKLIWWFIAAANEDEGYAGTVGGAEAEYSVR